MLQSYTGLFCVNNSESIIYTVYDNFMKAVEGQISDLKLF